MTSPATPTAEDIREQRRHVEQYRALLAAAETELAWMLAAAGRRPGDGSDQPGLFDPVAQPGSGDRAPWGESPAGRC
jgi:hypothetical protein